MEPPPPVAVKLEHVSWNENTTTAATNTTGTSSTIFEAPHSMMEGEETEDALQKKRTALAGQWRTPPTPFFSSGGNGGSYDGLPVLGTNHPATTTTSTTNSTTTSEDPNGTTTTTNVGLTTTTATVAATIPVVTVPGLLLQEDHVINAILPIAPPMSLPHSTEDYAKALQEAYRRGAEAAARAAALQQPPPLAVVAPSSSGPDLQRPLTTMSHGPPTTASVSSMINRTSLSSSPTLMMHPTSLAAPASSSSLTAANASTASTAMEANVSEPQPMQVQVVHHHHHHHILPAAAPPSHSSSTNTALPSHGTELSSAVMPMTTSPTAGTAPRMMNIDPNQNNKTAPIQVVSSHPPPPVTTLHQPSTDLSGMTSTTTTTPASNPTTILPMNSTTATKQQQQHQQRSVSLPDMSSYAAQQEEEKRQKRLARNRASARLRRLRKKNLVDAYEVEVGHLEKTMAQLQQHEWGCTNSSHTTGVQSATVLAEALSMDRGQQKLSVAERNKAATDILQQQLQFLQQLEDLMQEQYVLQQVAQFTLNGGETDTLNEWKDLQETLQLSPDQCQQIVDQSTGWDSEWQALQTVKSSLVAMRDNDWLWNEGCAGITDQFMAILHSNQISKLLLWADHNAETIEELDSVHAIHVVPDTPIFQFGMDNNPNEYMDDERMAA